jgi:sortase A
MKAAVLWVLHVVEWMLLGIGLGTLGVYGYETVEARRFQAEQTAAFERASRAEPTPVKVATGGLIGMLDIPRLQLSTPVIEGDDDTTLKRSVGHLPDTPMPWEGGNSAIAGHRDGLFRPLQQVKVGDEISVRTVRDEFRYRVTGTSVVMPEDLSVLGPTEAPSLTLITCYPFRFIGPAPKRFVVRAVRIDAVN